MCENEKIIDGSAQFIVIASAKLVDDIGSALIGEVDLLELSQWQGRPICRLKLYLEICAETFTQFAIIDNQIQYVLTLHTLCIHINIDSKFVKCQVNNIANRVR